MIQSLFTIWRREHTTWMTLFVQFPRADDNQTGDIQWAVYLESVHTGIAKNSILEKAKERHAGKEKQLKENQITVSYPPN